MVFKNYIKQNNMVMLVGYIDRIWSHTWFKQNIKSGFTKFTWIWSSNPKAMNDNAKPSKTFTSKENDKDEKHY
jgi:hypothetical protein